DDTDPAVQYGTDEWHVADPSLLNVGNFGPIYQGTSHATTSTNSTLTFPFNGTSMSVFGTIMVSTDANVTDPMWNCFVDGTQIGNPQPAFQFPENNWVLCDQPEIAAGSHVLTVQVQSKGTAFYFDYLVYTPLPDATFETAVLIYPNTDPAVSFGSDWKTFGGENGTNTKGSQVALNFHGTSASMYGFVPTELPHNSTSSTYTIDGGPPVSFTLQGLSGDDTEYNVIMFTTPTIPSGPHNLVVQYGGDSDHTPLVVEGFYVTNITTGSPASLPSFPPASASPLSTPTSRSSHAGAIAGGTMGGLVLLVLLAALAFCYKRSLRHPDATLANPYPMSMADGEAPPVADRHAYTSPPLVPGPYPLPDLGTGDATAASSAGRSAGSIGSLPSTSNRHPYLHPVTAPLHRHPSDTMSSSRGTNTLPYTHTQRPSASSVPASWRNSGHQQQNRLSVSSAAGVISHASEHGELPAPASMPPAPASMSPTPAARPVSTKLSREQASVTGHAPPMRDPSGALVVRQKDSGVRLYPRTVRLPGEDIVELPPGYSD
ncbi:hypothetical protein B0H19DRAFT_1097066, partial [Mycena capillaripes]